MSESDRVQRWRQRQRKAGKEPLTIWLTTTEKLRLEDMALTQRCSPSELVQRLLVQWHGESLPVTDTVTDTEQLRAIMQQELAQSHIVTATVTDIVTATLQQTIPTLVRALLREHQASSVSAAATDTVTATSPIPSADHIPDPTPEHVTDTDTAMVVVPMTYPVTDTVTDTVTATTASPPAKRKAPPRQRSVTATVADTVTVTGQALEPFDTTKYVLGKLCPRQHAWGNTGQSLLRRTNRHCCACDREKFHERKQAKRQKVSA